MKKILLFIILIPTILQAQNNVVQDSVFHHKMEWFKDAKLGIFIHWGLYAVEGVSESWSFFNGHITHEDYLKQTVGFTAKDYNPDYWAELIKESGARYSVITSKHHDGFALWDTKHGDLNAVKSSAAARDVLTPFVEALRKNNLKVGLYYSLPDWSYADYTDHNREIKRYKIADEPKRWDIFLDYYQGQLSELSLNLNPDLWWFDGDWEHNAVEWQIDKVRRMLEGNNSNVIFNSRLRGKGDYATPENGPPVIQPLAYYWELCLTMNRSWGYYPSDTLYKSPQQVIDIFVDCISMGGNLLLDIGPKADGTIPPEQVNILKELGKWTSKHTEAIYGTRKGIPKEYFYGPSALSKDSTVLYLYVRDIPKDNRIAIKGISSKILEINVMGMGKQLNQTTHCKVSWNSYPGITYIDIPENLLDTYYTVITLKLDGPIKLYKEHSGAIESN